MQIRTVSLIKVSCAIFVIYYTWLSVVFPQINGYLIPMGGILVLSIFLYVVTQNVGLNELFDPPIIAWILFCVFEFLVATFVAKDVSLAHRSVITFAELVVMCVAMIFVAKEEGSVDFLIKLMYVTCTGYVLSMLIINNQEGGRLALVNANGDANVCLIGIVTATLLLDLRRRFQPLVILSSICIMFYANIMTGSRKSFICVMFYLIFWFVIFLKTEWKLLDGPQKLFLGLCIVIAVIAIIKIVVPLVMGSTTITRFLTGNAEGDEIRKSLQREAMLYFRDHPLVGIGYNQFRVYNSAGIYSHSTYAEMLANGGVIGSILFFSPHIWCIKGLMSIVKKYKGQDFNEMRIALLFFIYMISSLFLAFGMVQTSNERVLMMYAVMIAYILCDRYKEIYEFE